MGLHQAPVVEYGPKWALTALEHSGPMMFSPISLVTFITTVGSTELGAHSAITVQYISADKRAAWDREIPAGGRAANGGNLPGEKP